MVSLNEDPTASAWYIQMADLVEIGTVPAVETSSPVKEKKPKDEGNWSMIRLLIRIQKNLV